MLNSAISIFEQKAIFSVALSPFLVRIVELTVWWLVAKPTRDADGIKISYGTIPSYTMDILSPLLCFVVFLFVAPMLWNFSRETLVVSLIPLFLLALFFDYWVIDSLIRVRYLLDGNPNYPFRAFDYLMIGSSIYDVLTLVLAHVLVVWQLSMIYRLVSQNRHSSPA